MASPGPLFDPRRAPLRERQRSEVEIEGDGLTAALLEDIDSSGYSDVEVCDRSGTDKGHMSRIRAKAAHPPQALVAWAIDHSRHRPPRYLVVACSVADHEPKPRPPPDVSAVLDAYRAELAAGGLDDHFRERVEKRLGVVLGPTRSDSVGFIDKPEES